jgi:hypothetical protein
MKGWLLTVGLIWLIGIEILRVYFIMPFPGSQQANTIDIAYFIDKNIWWLRLVGFAVVILPLISILKNSKTWNKIVVVLVVIFYGIVAYAFNFKFLADKMFYQPKEKLFATAQADTTAGTKLVIGVNINNEAKAYPIEIIGYHHQVKDTVGGEPLIVTYCTVCRTGRVYSPFVNGKMETFRLVGMDHFNAMFEDATTKSWWRQENGKAITGSLKGTQLKEITSAQMALQDWVALHPNSLVLQPDSNFKVQYDSLRGYDEGTIFGSLEHTDTASWQGKSWVVGVIVNDVSKAYDWNELMRKTMIQDSIRNTSLLVTIAENRKTFYVLNRKLNNTILNFYLDSNKIISDAQTHSQWQPNGICIEGVLKGSRLQPIQAYQEFWHSWKEFHPATTRYHQ